MLPKENMAPLPTALRKQIAAYIDAYYVQPRPKRAFSFAQADCKSIVPMASPCLDQSALAERLQQTDAGFAEALLRLIDKTGQKDSVIYKKANISKQHFSKIRNNPAYRPTKATAISFALALELDVEQTNELIGRAGYTLTNSSKFDLIVQYFIEQGIYDILQINMALFEFDQPLLGG